MRARSGVVSHKRHKKIKKQTKGMLHSRRRSYRLGKQAVTRSFQYAYRDRRNKKRDFRRLWITRINAALTDHGISYSKFIDRLNKSNIKLDRRSLSEIAMNDPKAFAKIVDTAQK